VVLRGRALNKDWKRVNELLDQGGSKAIFSKFSAELKGTESYQPICEELRDEYIAYFWLLRQAINLSAGDISESIAESMRNCGNVVRPIIAELGLHK
jgi:hypothetical protein